MLIKGGSRSTARQHGGERTFLQKEAMHLLYTPSVIFAVLLDPRMSLVSTQR